MNDALKENSGCREAAQTVSYRLTHCRCSRHPKNGVPGENSQDTDAAADWRQVYAEQYFDKMPLFMRFDGQLISWNDAKGFGFIRPRNGGQEIFVHIKAWPAGTARPQGQELLTFEVERNAEGKIRARNVAFAQLGKRRQTPGAGSQARSGSAARFMLALFCVLLMACAILWQVPRMVAGAVVGASMLCFGVYAHDKAAARKGTQRVPENYLHLLALIGGWPGALLAQQLLRHKSSKPAFRAAFWGTVILNVAVFLCIGSPLGSKLLKLLA